MAIYSGFSHETLWFSIAMLVYQRVTRVILPPMILGLASEEEGKEKDEDEAQSWPNILDASQGKCTKDGQLLYYPLVNVYITMENYNFSWENPL